jgi:hypothetical protein
MEAKNIAGQIAEVAKNYDYHEPPSALVKLQELLTNLIRAIRDWLNMLQFPQTGSSDTRFVGNLLQTLLVVTAIVAAVIVIVLIARRLTHLNDQRKLARGEMIVGESPLDSNGWHDHATQLFQNGANREACRAIYMSCLHLLDEAGIADFAPTKTNYEYFYSLKKEPTIASQFRKLVDTVETIWFGNKVAEPDDYYESLAHFDDIRQAVSQLPPSAKELAQKQVATR